MKRDRQVRLIALALAITIAVVCTVMILGIQINFNQSDTGAKISTPIIVVGLMALLLVYKLVKKQTKQSFILRHVDEKRKLSPYFTIFFTYFDYMLYCGILSGICGIVSGILGAVYKKMIFETLSNWSYTMSRMAIVFAVYILCFVIYTIGSMIAYALREKPKREVNDERV